MPDHPARPAALALLLTLAACASDPEIRLGPGSDVWEARRLLAEAAAEGPVPVTWRGEPPLSPPALLAAVERGVRGLDLRTTAGGDAGRRFAFDFTGGGQPPCDDPGGDPGNGRRAIPGPGVEAAFCDGGRAVATASSESGGDPERLIWRLTGRLVPDDYPDSYGFNLFGSRFLLGAGIGVGF